MILVDREAGPGRRAIPRLLAVGCRASRIVRSAVCAARRALMIETGEPREVMHFCLLCGLWGQRDQSLSGIRGADVHAVTNGELPGRWTHEQMADNYIAAVKKGILKTMRRWGFRRCAAITGRSCLRRSG